VSRRKLSTLWPMLLPRIISYSNPLRVSTLHDERIIALLVLIQTSWWQTWDCGRWSWCQWSRCLWPAAQPLCPVPGTGRRRVAARPVPLLVPWEHSLLLLPTHPATTMQQVSQRWRQAKGLWLKKTIAGQHYTCDTSWVVLWLHRYADMCKAVLFGNRMSIYESTQLEACTFVNPRVSLGLVLCRLYYEPAIRLLRGLA